MTKVEAIKRVIEDNGGIATWEIIYNQIVKYYPAIRNPKDWKAALRGVLYRDLGKSFKMVDEGIIALLNYDDRKLLLDNLVEEVGETEKSIQSSIRIGQDKFRKKLLKVLKFCPITRIDDIRILNASHIKPWAVCINKERLDVFNGFIFSPTIDKLFDKGLITFEDNKRLISSSTVSKKNLENIGLENGKIYPLLPLEGRLHYMEFHRNNIFIEN